MDNRFDEPLAPTGVNEGVVVEEDGVSNAFGEMRFCDCGGMNLTIGSLTLHLAEEEILALEDLVSAAAGMLQETEIESEQALN